MFPLNALLLLSEPSVLTFRALFELPEFGVRSHQFHGLLLIYSLCPIFIFIQKIPETLFV